MKHVIRMLPKIFKSGIFKVNNAHTFSITSKLKPLSADTVTRHHSRIRVD